ncbi:MAG: N-acetyltransferase [Deltaproteobacteria bacterium]|nr:N-acetyltransferase [Deltaproteobacteria bacterium]
MIAIRETEDTELDAILAVELNAFNDDQEIKTLVTNLFYDQSARPLISLMAFDKECGVGHIYLSHARLRQSDVTAAMRTMLLAPLAVVQSHQKQGIGQQLIYRALDDARQIGVDAVFVLGHPEYYPRCGFTPAGVRGFDAPYPIPKKNADAWMVIELTKGILSQASGGTLACADSLMKPEYWRE